MTVRKFIVLVMLLVASATTLAQESFFEAPRLFTESNTRFPQLVSSDGFGVAAYQRIDDALGGRGNIDVQIQTTDDGRAWSAPLVVVRGIRYEGSAFPPVFSIAMNDIGEILVAMVDYDPGSGADGTSIVRVVRSVDRGRTFQDVHLVSGDISLVSPTVFASADGGWLLTMERFDEPSNRIVYSHTSDGVDWDELRAIPADVLQTGTQSDVEHLVAGSRDIFLFVGENFAPPAVPPGEPDIPDTPQVYAIYTDNSGRSWSAVDPATGVELPGLPGIEVTGVDDPARFALELSQGGLVLPYTSMRILDEGLPSQGAL